MLLSSMEGFREPDSQRSGLRHELDRSFGRFFHEPLFAENEEGSSLIPALDVEEQTDQYVIQAEMPGMDVEDIDLEVSGRLLTIRGERRQEHREEHRYHLVERRYGTFQRSFTLPGDADVDGITADSKDGVLHIYVPKNPSEKARKIRVNRRDA